MCRSSIEPSCTTDPLARIPYKVYPNERIVNNSMLCLVCKFLVEDECSKTTRDRAPSHDGVSMWFMLAIRFVPQFVTGWGN
jgi:hypothetical protein